MSREQRGPGPSCDRKSLDLPAMEKADKERYPGPWEARKSVISVGTKRSGSAHGPCHMDNADARGQADAVFIALCSVQVPLMTARIRELEKQQEALLSVMERDHKFWERDSALLDKLETALRWYADMANYEEMDVEVVAPAATRHYLSTPVGFDGGCLARVALKEEK